MYTKLSTPIDTSNQPQSINPDNKSVRRMPLPSNVYSAYKDLPNFFKDSTDFSQVFENLCLNTSEHLSWRIQFDVLDNLRILNKYHPQELHKSLDSFIVFLLMCMDNYRSNLGKNSLLLIQELFGNFSAVVPGKEFISNILPKIIEKALSGMTFIRTEGRAALRALEENGCSNQVIDVLCEKTLDKNVNICELAFQTLAETLKGAKGDLTQKLDKEHMRLVFRILTRTLDGKRAVNIRIGEELCQEIKKYLPGGEEGVEKYLKDEMKLSGGELKLVMNAMQEKKTKAAPKSDFADFIKEKRKNQSFAVTKPILGEVNRNITVNTAMDQEDPDEI